MNFYFSLFQLIETVERLERDVQHLAGRALRISPRDARANRELLEQCETKMHEVKVLLNNKTHISKITLRKAALLFQILEIFYHRVLHLASATSNIGPDDESSMKAVWQMLSVAQKHYQVLSKTLFELTGIPVTLNLTGGQEVSAHDLPAILQKESGFQQDALKLLEKAIEVFGEEQDLAEQLAQVRKDLLDIKKRMKHFSPVHPVEKSDFAKAPASAEAAKLEKPAEKAEPAVPLRSSLS
ncbi:MAG TPA: hypothetical protein VJ873_02620 [bacterium]|nr:hypothetical protein [bacterium]